MHFIHRSILVDKFTKGMRSIINSGATARVSVLEKGPTTATTLDTIDRFQCGSLQGRIKPLTEMRLKISGKLWTLEHRSNIS